MSTHPSTRHLQRPSKLCNLLHGVVMRSIVAITRINNAIAADNKLYIGTINSLYSIDSRNLTLLQDITTGPILDSPYCNPDLTSCIGSSHTIQETDNYNKILHRLPDGLLVCGSVRQGICEIRSIGNLNRVLRNGSSPVAANSPNASTVSLVDETGEKLFVAATYSYESPYREGFPAVATRIAPNFLPINSGHIDGEAAVHIRAEYKSRFKIRYIGGFKDEHYIYWASVQKKYVQAPSISNPFVSRLIRICKDDDKYVSYSEIEIQCRGEDNTNFNILKSITLVSDQLIGVFTDAQEKDSAVCIYNMPKIRITFWYNIDRCRGGTDTIGLPHIGRDSKCINKSHLPLAEDTCLLGVGGTIETSQVAAIQYSDRILTSVAARNIQEHVIVVIGTAGGELLQFTLTGEHERKLNKYTEFVSGPDAVSKLEFLDDKRYYAINGNDLTIFRVSACGQQSTCTLCTANRDPLCGWCLLEGKCSSQAECQSTILYQCPRLAGDIQPQNTSVDAPSNATVFVPLVQLPAPEDDKSYECYFGAFKSLASWSEEGLRCPLPEQRPRLPKQPITGLDMDHVNVVLSVRSPLARANIVEHNFTFFDCGHNTICSTCTNSAWSCRWCAADRKCLSPESTCSKSNSATSKCARIHAENQPEILVADGTNSSISFKVQNMDSVNEERLSCIVKGLGQKHLKVAAKMHSSKVECSPAKFSYGVKEPMRNYSLEFVMDDEVVDKTSVTIYKCEEMATDCSKCLSLDPKWGCTWCESTCKFQEQCSNKPDKLKADMLCKDPVIYSFEPMSGPLEGGTRIEIQGRDLGSRIQDVQDRVIIAGSKCKVVDYTISTRIVCIVEKGSGVGPVRVTIGKSGRRMVESTQHYKFSDPVPKSIYPTFGPISGGTRLSIFGHNLNLGSNVTVFLDNLPCKIVEETDESEQIICTTSPSSRIYTVTAIRLQIDDFVKLFDAKFAYRPDPTVMAINPTTTFESGGRTVTVDGSNFDSILMAKMFFLSSVDEPTEIISEFGDCQIHNSTRMHCQSPRLLLSPNHRSSTYARWPVGFYMDEVKSVRNLGYRIQMSSVPDPQFLPFKGIKIQAHDQPLIITGNYLSQAASLDEYTVKIGTERCPVFLLDAHQLLCKVPEVQPEATDDAGIELPDGRPMVVVRIGSLRAELGLLEYESSSIALFRMNLMRLFLILLSGIGILGAAGVLLFLLWKRRSNQHERDYKRIQLQMEQMETNVRNECKQAFAELQTDMTDLTAAIDDVGIPYHERAEFVSRLLFRDSTENSILHSWGGGMNIYSSQLPIALAQFDSLLWNRQFVFLMVHMAESDPTITVSERSTICSLLIAALSRNMGYCTDVILSLLSAHIEHCVNTKTAHLLFRRTESLVEKLFQQWLTISLFPYLNDTNGPGRSFFLLYKALKYQTEKGPVDSVTGNARYSLNEQKLLREAVDAQVLTLLVIPVEGFDQAPILCRVLHCDTISQVKTKLLDLLYKNQPFSSRITIDQFDLEWRCPKKGSILLLDDDRPGTKGLKKLNTVGYYGLPNNSLLAMQPRSQNSFTYRSGSSDTTCSAWSSTHLIDSASSPTSNSDTHYYHLALPQSSNGISHSLDKRKYRNLEQNTPNIPEVYLTRLLTCKGTIQKFVDDFFNSVTFNYSGENNIPLVLKYVMDFLDQEAERHNITDPDIIQAWKTNVIILRFWMQLVHNPDCLFDVQRQPCLDASLTVIGQTLIDAFSRSEYTLGKESPSSKLLFVKDIARYRPVAAEMFRRIKHQPSINEKIFYDHVNSMSKTFGEGVSSTVAVAELLNWVKANGLRLVELLGRDHLAIRHRLADRLQQIIHCTIAEPEHIYATLQ
uniref:Sema domain-containing protein n=1 Tax=Acrobeloides nanus TaxID=290746 RepID=A0A914CJF6_9BILA